MQSSANTPSPETWRIAVEARARAPPVVTGSGGGTRLVVACAPQTQFPGRAAQKRARLLEAGLGRGLANVAVLRNGPEELAASPVHRGAGYGAACRARNC
jgi:hypothetical protein